MIRAGIELLAACIRDTDAGLVRQRASGPIDWAVVLEEARRHAVTPLVYDRLHKCCPEAVPEDVLATLAERSRQNLRRNLFLTGELVKTIALFDQAGIPVMAYKGPVLASFYENLGLRQFSDLDLLIRPGDAERADALLREHGFRAVMFKSCPQEQRALPFARAFHYEMGYVNGQEVPIDLHWALMPGFFAVPSNASGVWDRSRAVNFGSRQVRTLSPEDMLLLACMHGTKHIWERLGWVRDVAVLARRDGLDWDAVFRIAGEFRMKRALALGLRLAQALAGVEPAARISADRSIDGLVESVRRQLFEDPGMHSGVMASCAFIMKSREHAGDAVRCCVERVLQPTMAEWASIELPRPLFPLYYLLRPMRLAGKHGLGD